MWTKIKPYMPWNVIEFCFYFALFSVANDYFFDGSKASFATALAGCGLMMAIQTRRKLYNGGHNK